MALCGWLCVSYNSLFLVSVHFEHSVQSGYPKNRAKSDRGENTTQTAKTPRPRAPSRATAQHARVRPTTCRDCHRLHHRRLHKKRLKLMFRRMRGAMARGTCNQRADMYSNLMASLR